MVQLVARETQECAARSQLRTEFDNGGGLFGVGLGEKRVLSRAIAGSVRGSVIFALPGSSKAVDLAMKTLIVPELGHIVNQLAR